MDIVERLRAVAAMDLRTGGFLAHTMDTAAMAADLIERQRAALRQLEAEIEGLRLRIVQDEMIEADMKREVERLTEELQDCQSAQPSTATPPMMP